MSDDGWQVDILARERDEARAEVERLRAEVKRVRLDTLREIRAYVEGPGALHDCCYGTDVNFLIWLDEQIAALDAAAEVIAAPGEAE